MPPNEIITTECRICGNTDLVPVVDLGNQCLSGIFPKKNAPNPSRSPLQLIKCDNSKNKNVCGLLQLKQNADLDEMYGSTYGYYSSISPSMVSHLAEKVDGLINFVHPKEGEIVLDIGCNDGTMLNLFGRTGMKRIGIDPSSEKFKDHFDADINVIHDFFSAIAVRKIIAEEKCKIITAIAMFYDINDPVSFMREIRSLLAKDGIWALELSYMPLMLKNLTYDQICHEHVTYLGLKQMEWLTNRTGLKIIDVSFNFMNGGSFYLYVSRDDSDYEPNRSKLEETLKSEDCLHELEYYERFNNRILTHRDELLAMLNILSQTGKKIYGYGASTKGNVILNFCGTDKTLLPKICDANPEKNGLVTPGTKIDIISKDQMRLDRPDYLIVFIWHFRKEVLKSELDYIMNGGTMIFVLPRLHIVNRENYDRYVNANFEELSFSL
jgi:NDP-4-keto-2,6-dideoxyhexose 3-C-methyltransferase